MLHQPRAITHDQVDGCDIAQTHRIAASPIEYHVTEFRQIVFSCIAQRVLATSDIVKATGGILVVSGQSSECWDIDSECSRFVRVEGYSYLVVAPAVRVRIGNSRYTFDACLHDLPNEVAVTRHDSIVARLRRQGEPGNRGTELILPGKNPRLGNIGWIALHLIEAIHHLD